MAKQDLGYAEPEIEPYPEELARKMIKKADYYLMEAAHHYAFNYLKRDGTYSNPNAEDNRLVAILLKEAASELMRLHNKVKHG